MGKQLTNDEFIEKAMKMHGDTYEYTDVQYKNARSKVWIKCRKHGCFLQTPNSHLVGHGCVSCRDLNMRKNRSSNIVEFKEKAMRIHGQTYDYSFTNYVNNNTYVKILCKRHGLFKQTPNNHLSGKGCAICKNSKGEIKIRDFLIINNIKFEQQKRFDNCRNILPLPFDFYLPNNGLLIEYDGKQHSNEKSFYSGKFFQKIRENDRIKTEFSKKENIKLIRISYKDSVDLILNNNLLK